MNTIYYLKFFLKNFPETKEYKVLEDEQNRLNNILQNRSANDISGAFFCFDTIDGLSVCISIRDIQTVQMLFDTGVINTSSNNNNTYNKDLSIILRNEKEEFPIETEDSKGIYGLTYNLDSVSEEDNMFLPIIDVDGELNLFNIKEIIYIEADINIVREGQQQYEDEDSQ